MNKMAKHAPPYAKVQATHLQLSFQQCLQKICQLLDFLYAKVFSSDKLGGWSQQKEANTNQLAVDNQQLYQGLK